MENGKKIESMINSTGFSPRHSACYCATKMHRYLQAQLFKFCLHYIGVMARNFRMKRYDGRNEWACETADKIYKEFISDSSVFSIYDEQEYEKIISSQW